MTDQFSANVLAALKEHSEYLINNGRCCACGVTRYEIVKEIAID